MKGYDQSSPPDPSFLFRLNDLVQPGANLFAFQKIGVGADTAGVGKWGFDVFFEKEESEPIWDCKRFVERSRRASTDRNITR
jgi:hypothetical protein